MARRSREAVQKRLRERRRAEKAEQKRLKRLARKQGETLDVETADGEPGEGGELLATQEGEPIEEGESAEEVAPADEAAPAESVKTD